MNITGIIPIKKLPERHINTMERCFDPKAGNTKRPITRAMMNMPGTTQTIF
jgi:hypothetical protein